MKRGWGSGRCEDEVREVWRGRVIMIHTHTHTKQLPHNGHFDRLRGERCGPEHPEGKKKQEKKKKKKSTSINTLLTISSPFALSHTQTLTSTSTDCPCCRILNNNSVRPLQANQCSYKYGDTNHNKDYQK